MKHLLTALIAAFVLVLPLHADESLEPVSVRVIDHEGKPVGGLELLMRVGSGSDTSVSGVDGIATFELSHGESNESILVGPPVGYSGWFPIGDINSAASNLYAFDRVTRFMPSDIVDGTLTLRVPESVPCVVQLKVSGISAMAPMGWGLQRRGGPILSWRRSMDEPTRELIGRDFLKSMLPIQRGQPAQIGVVADGKYLMVEIKAEQTNLDTVHVEIAEPDRSKRNGTIRYRRFDGNTDPVSFHLVSADGQYARVKRLNLKLVENPQVERPISWANASVPSGEFLIVPLHRPHDTFGLDLWAPGSVFDTMLRLRRGEDLPHLKRITIPEDATVELSSEDFLAPPADDPKDATP